MKAIVIITDIAQGLAVSRYDQLRRGSPGARQAREYNAGWNDGICCRFLLMLRSYLKTCSETQRRLVGSVIRSELSRLKAGAH